MLPWLVEYAPAIMNRVMKGADGRTAWELEQGKPWKQPVPPFGEQVYFLPHRVGSKLNKMDTRWEEGAFIGVNDRSGELRVMTASGAADTRSVRRKPLGNRWDKELLEKQIGVPWMPYPGAADSKVLPAAVVIPVSEENVADVVPRDGGDLAPRGLHPQGC